MWELSLFQFINLSPRKYTHQVYFLRMEIGNKPFKMKNLNTDSNKCYVCHVGSKQAEEIITLVGVISGRLSSAQIFQVKYVGCECLWSSFLG